MLTVAPSIDQLILDRLAQGEIRLLSLIVAIRRAQAPYKEMKGDLSAAAKSALRNLINRNIVADNDGVYSLLVRQ